MCRKEVGQRSMEKARCEKEVGIFYAGTGGMTVEFRIFLPRESLQSVV